MRLGVPKPRGREPDQGLMQWKIANQVDGQRSILYDTSMPPMPPGDEEVMESREKRRNRDFTVSGVVFILVWFIVFCCCSCYYFPACLLCFVLT